MNQATRIMTAGTIRYRDDKGRLHRTDGPAVEFTKQKIEHWYYEGKLHRDGAPATLEKDKLIWYKNGKIHRQDGPAVILNDKGLVSYVIEGNLVEKNSMLEKMMQARYETHGGLEADVEKYLKGR